MLPDKGKKKEVLIDFLLIFTSLISGVTGKGIKIPSHEKRAR
jgi:hypothetical protein